MLPKPLRKLSVLKNTTPIIMLSHMRANTSLFGHILGNNPEINGYYEMHIGYYSWKSLIRQKLIYLEKHTFKNNSKYVFDKVLHNEHYINCELLLDKKVKVIISLRPPNETIPSIINLYNKINPEHQFSTESGAIKYYRERLNMLHIYAEKLKNNFLYLDANLIKEETERSFSLLEQELNLVTPLTKEYNMQVMTGAKFAGDHSEALKKGKIDPQKSDFSNIILNPKSLDLLMDQYKEIRKKIIHYSKNNFQ